MKFIATICRLLLSLRYRIVIKESDLLSSSSPKLILPNHQALVDPIIIFSQIYRHATAVPVVTESYFKIPVAKNLLKRLGAVSVSDLSAGNRDLTVLETIVTNVIAALKDNKNVVLYPSGQIAGQGFEKIFNKQSAWIITKNLPDNTQIIGVRIRGLWGSMWSKAQRSKSPNFLLTLLKGLFFVLANLVFFAPRRRVTLEFYDITQEAKTKASESKLAFNNFLEELYNQGGEEKAFFLRHFFYFPQRN
jgi:1-acyl-sn-glycerol-3-phosphate acyltransferase